MQLTILCENSVERVSPAGLRQAQKLVERFGERVFYATVGCEILLEG